MLLETLDIKQNDVIIFSRNIFNLENNFKILSKDDPTKEIRYVSYGEVCRYVEDFAPKNLIVYRLLINSKDFNFTSVKYGIAIYVNGQSELVFFDPVFAVKELEENAGAEDLKELRFRIQQIGLTTLNRVGGRVNYAEIYSVDLEATEAKFQNDKAFVDALLAVDNDLSGINNKGGDEIPNAPSVRRKKTELKPSGEIQNRRSNYTDGEKGVKKEADEVIDENGNGKRKVRYNISEDKNFDYKKVSKINIAKDRQGMPDSGSAVKDETTHGTNSAESVNGDAEAKSPLGRFIKNKSSSSDDQPKSSGKEDVKNDNNLFYFE